MIKVRLLEGFSAEEGFADMFGLTEFDGQSRYGEVPVYADGSFAAKVPANVPLHMQLHRQVRHVAWPPRTSGSAAAPGEQRFCGGCHEDRAKNTVIAPGSTEAVLRGAVDLDTPPRRAQVDGLQLREDPGRPLEPGHPADLRRQVRQLPRRRRHQARQPQLHRGRPHPGDDADLHLRPARRSRCRSWSASASDYDYPASYVSLMGLEMELGENQVEIQVAGGARCPATSPRAAPAGRC